jgi:hypothetical protein
MSRRKRMAHLAVKGFFKDGKVELTEQPAGIQEAPVMVVFLTGNGQTAAETDDAETREARRQRAFAQMREGIDLGGPPYPTREELYDRVDRWTKGAG